MRMPLPLTRGQPGSDAGRAMSVDEEVVVVDSLVVDQALPAAVREATSVTPATVDSPSLPSFLPEQEGGCPAYRASMFGPGPLPAPVATVRVDGVPIDAFVVQLTQPTLERMSNGYFASGAWVVFVPEAEDSFGTGSSKRFPRLLISSEGAFNATGEHWTVGFSAERDDKVRILYLSHVAPRSETPRRSGVRVVGRAIGVFDGGEFKRIG